MATGTDVVPLSDDDLSDSDRQAIEAFNDLPDTDPPGMGRSIEDMADDPEEAEQFTLFGTAPSVTGTVKGGKPTGSKVKFKAKAQNLPGQFHVDDVVELRVLARVDGVSFTTRRDVEGTVIDMDRVHTLTLTKIEQIGDVDDAFGEVDGRA